MLLAAFPLILASSEPEWAAKWTSTISALQEQVASLQGRVAGLETEKASLQGRVAILEASGASGSANMHGQPGGTMRVETQSLGETRRLSESTPSCCRWTASGVCGSNVTQDCTQLHVSLPPPPPTHPSPLPIALSRRPFRE